MELVSLCGAKRRGQAKIKEISKINNNQMVTRAVEKNTKRKEEREEQ